MTQVPLAPPPQTGQPIDGWLYLLWRRLTQTGQILWESITPGTSADVAAVVTDETGSPGSLVFSGNPTLTGCTVSGAAFTSRGITDNSTASALTIDSSGNVTVGVSSPAFTNPFTVYASGGTSAGMVGIGDGTGAQMVAIRVTNDASQPQLIVQKRRGSFASPSAVASSDGLGDVVFQGYGGTNTRTLASIRAIVDTYTSDTDISAYLRFSVSPSGSAAAVEALRITAAKRIVAVATIATGGYTVATLPAGTVGDRAYVTDALAPAYGVAVAGGGAVTIPVFYNGAAWICA